MVEPNITEALKRIEEARLSVTTSLDLSNLNLKVLPLELSQLTALITLNCSGNRLTTLEGIKDLTALTTVNCNNNQLTALEGIKGLTALTTVNCSNNNLTTLADIKGLTALATLACGSNQLTTLSDIKGLTALTFLDCKLNKLTTLTDIKNLTMLTHLYCRDTQLTTLEGIKDLTALTVLECNNNRLTTLEGIKDLTALITLNFSVNRLTTLADIKGLTALTTLNCGSNQLTTLAGIKGLTVLNALYCGNNQLTTLAGIKGLTALITLNCIGNYLTTLSDIKGLTALITLNCGSNQLTTLSDIKGLTALTFLDCHSNQLTTLSDIKGLTALTVLDCHSNQLTTLSDIKGLTALITLNCGSNQLTNRDDIKHFAYQSNMKKLKLPNSPYLKIPNEITNVSISEDINDKTLVLLRRYFNECDKGVVVNNNIKLLFVGNGRVGKSTLAYCLKNNKPPEESFESTHGIDSTFKEIDNDNGVSCNINFLDFGGQGIYHATHRLFFVSNAIYIAMWAEETDEVEEEFNHDLSYWLNLIMLHGKSSEIIVIKNQTDKKNELALTHPALDDDKFKSIQQLAISAKKYEKISSVIDTIKPLLSNVYSTAPLIPKSWLGISEWFNTERAKSKKIITYQYFEKECIARNISSPKALLTYLDRAGECIYLGSNETLILDSNWGITAVYKLFDSSLGPISPREFISNNKGSVTKEVIEAHLSTYYDDYEVYLIFAFMEKVNICFKHPEYSFYNRSYVFPSLLNKNPPSITYRTGYSHKYQFTLPAYHRLIIEDFIRVTSYLSPKSSWWFNGIDIAVGDLGRETTATIVTCSDAATVTIYISGDKPSELLKKVIKTLHRSQFFTPISELICIPRVSKEWVDVEKVKDVQGSGNINVKSADGSFLNCSEYCQALGYEETEDLTNETNKEPEVNSDIRFSFNHSVMIISAFLFDFDIFAFTVSESPYPRAKALGHLLNVRKHGTGEYGHNPRTTNDKVWEGWLENCINKPSKIKPQTMMKFALHLSGFVSSLLIEMKKESGISINDVPKTIEQLITKPEDDPQIFAQLNSLLLYTANQVVSNPEKIYNVLFKTLHFTGCPPVNIVSNYMETLNVSAEDSKEFAIPEDYLAEVNKFKEKGRISDACPD